MQPTPSPHGGRVWERGAVTPSPHRGEGRGEGCKNPLPPSGGGSGRGAGLPNLTVKNIGVQPLLKHDWFDETGSSHGRSSTRVAPERNSSREAHLVTTPRTSIPGIQVQTAAPDWQVRRRFRLPRRAAGD